MEATAVMYGGSYIKRDNLFGRKVYFTNASSITAANVVQILGNALTYHTSNIVDIDYLERYHDGDQPIRYRVKDVRPEINNKIVENYAWDSVAFHTSQDYGEPIKYVLPVAAHCGIDSPRAGTGTGMDTRVLDVSVSVCLTREAVVCTSAKG